MARAKRCKKGYVRRVAAGSCKCVKKAARTVVRRRGKRAALCRKSTNGRWARKICGKQICRKAR